MCQGTASSEPTAPLVLELHRMQCDCRVQYKIQLLFTAVSLHSLTHGVQVHFGTQCCRGQGSTSLDVFRGHVWKTHYRCNGPSVGISLGSSLVLSTRFEANAIVIFTLWTMNFNLSNVILLLMSF